MEASAEATTTWKTTCARRAGITVSDLGRTLDFHGTSFAFHEPATGDPRVAA